LDKEDDDKIKQEEFSYEFESDQNNEEFELFEKEIEIGYNEPKIENESKDDEYFEDKLCIKPKQFCNVEIKSEREFILLSFIKKK
jgi:hypothetical protein